MKNYNSDKLKKRLPVYLVYAAVWIGVFILANRYLHLTAQIAAITATLAVVMLIMHINTNTGRNKNYKTGREYGSSRWGTHEDIKDFIDPVFRNNIILSASEFLTMNSRPAKWWTGRNKNVVVIGDSGSGKTRYNVKPNLMQMNSSYVVTDPKGTVLTECGKMLHDNGYKIKVLNTINFKKSMHYNPFVYIHSEKDILKLANTIIVNTKGEGDKAGEDFWVKAERLYYTALIAYIHFECLEEEKNFETLLALIDESQANETDENYKNPVDLLFDDLAREKPRCFAVRQYRKYKLAAGKTAKSIMISCGARLAPFDIEEVRNLMSHDELELDTLGDEKTALFVIMSDTDDTFNFIIAMMFTQLFNTLCEKADDFYGGRLPVHVRCLIDEFANIGEIPRFDKLIATIRSREISATIFLQAQSQLKTRYKEAADTIISNCNTRIFLGGTDKNTLKDMSELLGKETIDMYNESKSRGTSVSHGQNYQKSGRDLMSPDEIFRMDGRKCIVLLKGCYPFLSDKYDITKHPNYSRLMDADPKNKFDVEKYLKHPTVKRKPIVGKKEKIDIYDIPA